FTDDGIQIIDFDKPAGKDGRIPVTACENPIVPTKIFREPEKHVTQYEVAIKTGHYWRHVVFNGQVLQSVRAVDVLGNFGAHISDNRMMAKYFSKIIALNERLHRLQEVKTYNQPGWTDDTYTNFVWPTGGEDYIVDRKDFNYKKIFTPKGKVAEWLKIFLEAINRGGAIARIYVGTALCAPLIRPLSSPNLQTHLYGLSGKGKTALEKITASIYGSPKELLATFGSTNKNRQLLASAFSDLPTFIDEMETLNGKMAENALAQSIYEYSLNKTNQANKRDGTAREPFYFYGSRLYTGERPMLKTHDQQGAFKRLLQLPCENLYPDTLAAKMHVVSESNYGHFGRQWIEFIAANLDEIRDRYQTFAVAYPATNKEYEPTLVKAIVAASCAMQYFKILLGESDDFNDIAFGKDVEAIIGILPTLKEISSGERALADLRSFVDGHPNYFVRESIKHEENDRVYEVEAEANEIYGKIFYSGEVAFFPTALRKILEKELGFASTAEVLAQWAEKKSVLTFSKDRKYQHK
ncbi:MAG: DUF927 domain-containing protein, partial [Selenomonadaceae bacterium]|nr:DUF927 domain-containing protein [Selenomonadaceae bacterium]